jgi:hypothetical protein
LVITFEEGTLLTTAADDDDEGDDNILVDIVSASFTNDPGLISQILIALS